MKKVLLILSFMCIASIVLAVPFFPQTNVVHFIANPEQNLDNIRQGVEVLTDMYDENKLIIFLGPEIPDFNHFMAFNNVPLLYKDHQQVKYGQPIKGMMQHARFNTSPLLINDLLFEGNRVSGYIKFSDSFQAGIYVIHILSLDKIDGINTIVHAGIAQQFLTNHISNLQLTIPWFHDSERGMIVIHRADNITVGQAAITDSERKPFRVMRNTPASIIGTHNPHTFDNFYIFNNTFSPLSVHIELKEIYATGGWHTTFSMYGGEEYSQPGTNETIPAEGMIGFFPTVYPFDAGMSHFTFSITNDDHVVELPYYFTTNDVEVLIIQDDGCNVFDESIINILSDSNITYGIFKPEFGEIGVNDLYYGIKTIIWNAPIVLPNLKIESIPRLTDFVDYGGFLLVMGQYLADALSNTEVIAYADQASKDFIKDILGVEFRRGIMDIEWEPF